MEYNLAVAGGTFDRLHSGHKAFLEFIFAKSKRVLLGLTSDTYATRNKGNIIESFDKRRKILEKFLDEKNLLGRVIIASIENVLYPKEWEELPIDAIFVTSQTASGADIINEDRKKRGLSVLDVVVVPFVYDEEGNILSSSLIRQGIVDTQGKRYIPSEWFAQTLILPKDQRQWFHAPFGVLKQDKDIDFLSLIPGKITTIGDFITKDFHEKGVRQHLCVVDFFVQRQKIFSDIKELGFNRSEKVLEVVNHPGHITPSLFQAFVEAVKNPREEIVIKVVGEEDLAVLPAVLALPLGDTIFYGQPGEGLVQLDVTTEHKNLTYQLLKKLKISTTRGS